MYKSFLYTVSTETMCVKKQQQNFAIIRRREEKISDITSWMCFFARLGWCKSSRLRVTQWWAHPDTKNVKFHVIFPHHIILAASRQSQKGALLAYHCIPGGPRLVFESPLACTYWLIHTYDVDTSKNNLGWYLEFRSVHNLWCCMGPCIYQLVFSILTGHRRQTQNKCVFVL